MSIGMKMRGLGESTYYTKLLKPKLEQALEGETYEAEHLVGRKTFIIHTDRVSDEKIIEVNNIIDNNKATQVTRKSYNHHIDISWRDLNRYAKCKSLDEMNQESKKYGFTSYGYDLTSDGWWIYPLNGIDGGLMGFSRSMNSRLKRAEIYAPNQKINIVNYVMLESCQELESAYVYTPKAAQNCQAIFYNCPKLKLAEVDAPRTTNLDSYCYNCKSLKEFRFLTTLSQKNITADNAWYGCQLSAESVQNVSSSIPNPSSSRNTTTIGIHIDHQTDEEVLNALTLMEEKGWVLTIQWNGTPTEQAASTFALRQPVYARISIMKDIDGKEIEFLDWGHYVTKPEDYQQFSSLEEARDYFNIPEEINN